MDVETLFELSYPIGTDVVVVDDEDRLIRGKVKAINDDGLTVQCVGLKADVISWPVLRFIAHDGFPVREIKGPYKENDWTEVDELRRKLRAAELNQARHTCPAPTRRYARFGDPFEVVGDLTPAYLDNDGWDFADSFESEVLLFDAPDGAIAMLWDFESVYEFGDA